MTNGSGTLGRLINKIDAVTEFVGRSISWLTLVMMIVMFAVVILRYLFNSGSIAMQESVMYLHATVFMMAAGYTLKHDGHVRVDIFYREMSPQRKAMVDFFGSIFLLIPVMIFMGMMSWQYVMNSWHVMESSPEAGGIPGVYLLKTLIIAMVALMLLQAIAEALRNLLLLMGKGSSVEHHVNEEKV
ncbi:TRAP transporter small permease subunit [Oceanospirillum maris]|jgi:TRAP-type mannitol/chloroaromatic compound transport system permease small subunit|uniref:TRAP transporter small permease subunit n=1 Tax=Oceanospirillum maris TaxID=64977 RepID=UPI0004100400|nr:TRAP transporter small permease subunit [Oceanospirillum maris]